VTKNKKQAEVKKVKLSKLDERQKVLELAKLSDDVQSHFFKHVTPAFKGEPSNFAVDNIMRVGIFSLTQIAAELFVQAYNAENTKENREEFFKLATANVADSFAGKLKLLNDLYAKKEEKSK